MSNPTSASNAWAKIKKKIVAQAGEATPASGSTSPVKKTPGSKRKKDAEAEGGEDGDDESPTKKPKPRARKPTKKKAESEENGDDEEIKVKGEVSEEDDTFV